MPSAMYWKKLRRSGKRPFDGTLSNSLRMNRAALSIAVLVAAAMTVVHVVVGGQMVAEPLLASDLATLPRMTLYLCWHGITVVLA